MATGPARRLAIGAVALLAMFGLAWGGETPPGCGLWEAPVSGRVGDLVTIGATSAFGGNTVDVRLGDSVVATGPFGTGNIPPDWFVISFTIPDGTPVGITGLGIRTRTSGQFGFPNCDWQVRQFEVQPSFVLGGTTTSTTATPASSTSTTSTTAPETPDTTTTSTVVTTTTTVVQTTVASTTATTMGSAVDSTDPSQGGGGGLPGWLVALLAVAGASAFFGLGVVWRGHRTAP